MQTETASQNPPAPANTGQNGTAAQTTPAMVSAQGDQANVSRVKVNVARSAVRRIRIIDTDIVLDLDTGERVYIRDGAVQTMVDSMFSVEFSDGAIESGQQLMQSAGVADISPIAATGPNDGTPTAIVDVSASPTGTPAAAICRPAARRWRWLCCCWPRWSGLCR